jgi:hypothetical protein
VNRTIASALSLAATTAAIACVAAIATGNAYAETPTIDNTPFEQARSQYQASRDEVRALTSEDSGSSYFARRLARLNGSIAVAGTPR